VNKIVKVTNPNWDKYSWFDRYDAFVVVSDNFNDIYQLIINEHGLVIFKKGIKYYVEPEGWENRDDWIFEVIGESELHPEVVLASFNAA